MPAYQLSFVNIAKIEKLICIFSVRKKKLRVFSAPDNTAIHVKKNDHKSSSGFIQLKVKQHF